jgi:hypothetical protein
MENKMTILHFKASDKLKKLALETLRHKEFQVPYQDKTTSKKTFLFVKDSGIYLMNGWGEKDYKNNVVVYAKGYEPDSDDCWNKCRDAVGGDDFGEAIHMRKDQLTRLANGGDMSIRVSETQFEWRA